jgi:hypothetical protein
MVAPVDDFTIIRITRIIGTFKKTHGRDISAAELEAAGVAAAEVDYLVRKGAVDKYQVTNGKGARENRFKLHHDWRSLKET